jgi:hypothetical protein
MNTRTEKIYAALDQLCDALDLGRSESSTERLFLILASRTSCGARASARHWPRTAPRITPNTIFAQRC